MAGRIDFEFRFQGGRRPHGKAGADSPMRILVLADFSGLGTGSPATHRTSLAERSTVAVDVDNFEKVLSRFSPRLTLSFPGSEGSETAIEFKNLDDFHPDALYQTLDIFQSLRQTRRKLLNPETFQEVAAELRREWNKQLAPDRGEAKGSTEDDASTLQRLLGKAPVDARQSRSVGRVAGHSVNIDQIIRGIVEPHIKAGSDPQQPQLVAALDEAIGEQMRAVLHDPGFQALESTWRAVHLLLTGLETGEELQVHLLAVTRDELAADISSAAGDLEATGLYRVLVEKGPGTPGGQPWSMVAANTTFGTDAEDLSLLAALGAVASQAGGPLLAGARPQVVGCQSLVDNPDPRGWKDGDDQARGHWRALRKSTAASWIGLALPRVLLRLPYGSQTEPLEQFHFEEQSGGADHEAYLWGNPAFVCTLLLARSFQERGWSMQPGDHLEWSDLPAHVYQEAGEPRLKPCAEVCLTERAAEAILGCGVMPVLSYPNRNAVRLPRLQSLADPPAALSGPWQ